MVRLVAPEKTASGRAPGRIMRPDVDVSSGLASITPRLFVARATPVGLSLRGLPPRAHASVEAALPSLEAQPYSASAASGSAVVLGS